MAPLNLLVPAIAGWASHTTRGCNPVHALWSGLLTLVVMAGVGFLGAERRERR